MLRDRIVTVVPDTSQDADFQTLVRSKEADSRYRAYVERIRACVKFPLSVGAEPLGVLCLHRRTVGPFNLGRVKVVEHLSNRVAIEAACVLASEQQSIQAKRLRAAILDPHAIVARVGDLGIGKVRLILLEDLSNKALEMSGAYRTAVCLIDPDYSKVAVTAKAGEWPQTMRMDIPLTLANSAVVAAIKRQETYVCDDVREPGSFYLKNEPDHTGSTVAIPLKYGTHLLGALAVEWRATGACKRPLVDNLEVLCERYAGAIKQIDVDQQMRLLETAVRERPNSKQSEPNYQEYLQIVAEMLGVGQGAVFIRRPETGKFHLVASLARPDLVSKESSAYESGFGVTGWILEQNRWLKLDNLRNENELAQVVPPVEWKSIVPDDFDSQDRENAYLGVPISVGNELYGVLRFNAPTELRRFDSVDLHIAQAAADRLATKLFERAEATRTEAKLELSRCVPQIDSLGDMCSAVFSALDRGLGSLGDALAGHIRLLDRLQEGNGPPDEVLLLQYYREPKWPLSDEWKGPSLSHRRGDDTSGWVWENDQPFLDLKVDAPDAKCVTLGTPEWFRKNVGSVFVSRLEADSCGDSLFLGTLHVYKRHRRSFSSAEVQFIEEIAKIAAPGLLSVRDKDDKCLELEIKRASDEFLVGVLEGKDEPLPSRESRLLLTVLALLRKGMGGKQGWLLLPDPTGQELHAHDESGKRVEYVFDSNENRIANIPAISTNLFREWLANSMFRVAYRLNEDPLVAQWFNSWNSPYLDRARDQSGVLCVESSNTLLAAFVIRVVRPNVISYRRAEVACARLATIGEYIRLARQVRDDGIAKPLVLLGALVSTLEHETRSPLSRLVGALEELNRPNRTPEERARMTEIVLEEKVRLENILRKLTSIVGCARAPFRHCNVREPLQGAIDLLTSKVGRIDLTLDVPPTEVTVLGLADYLEQAFTFVIKNAIEAVGKDNGQGRIQVTLTKNERDACIVVSDNGPGMDHDTQQKVLQPFFTTKQGGTGLGLKAAYSIICSHKGQLRIEPNNPSGLRVVITLPLSFKGETA